VKESSPDNGGSIVDSMGCPCLWGLSIGPILQVPCQPSGGQEVDLVSLSVGTLTSRSASQSGRANEVLGRLQQQQRANLGDEN
jgi:hypothetical protein